MKRHLLTVIFLAVCLCAYSCSRGLSPEEQKQVETLRSELEGVRKEASAAEAQVVQYSGGLVKGLLQARLEILKTTEALIQQRIHAIEGRAPVSLQTLASKPDPERAERLAEEIKQQEVGIQCSSPFSPGLGP